MKRSQANNISPSSFRVRRPIHGSHEGGSGRPSIPMEFLPVVVTMPERSAPGSRGRFSGRSGPDFEVVLTSGRRILVPVDFEDGALRRLVQVLEAVRAC